MPKLIHRNPSYRKHRRQWPSIATINGIYLHLPWPTWHEGEPA